MNGHNNNSTHQLCLVSGDFGVPGEPGPVGPKGKKGDNGFSVHGPPGFRGVEGQFHTVHYCAKYHYVSISSSFWVQESRELQELQDYQVLVLKVVLDHQVHQVCQATR